MKLITSLLVVCGLIISGCATSSDPNDPYEAYNRKVFTANMTMDTYVLRPATVGYTYIPEPIRYAVGNFYGNLRDFISLANDMLQADGMNTMQTIMRISLNSTFGLLGLIDISSSLGLPEYKNTFGNTLKTWGWTDSSYFLVPFLGPGTFRDQLGLIPDIYFNPVFWIINDPIISWSIFGINLLDMRSGYLDQDQLLEQTLDPYATIRDLYLQKNGEYKFPINQSESQMDDDIFSDDTVESHNSASAQKTVIESTNTANIP